MLVTLHLVIHPCVEFALIAYYLSLIKLHCLPAGSVATKIKWKAIGILCRCGSTVLHCPKIYIESYRYPRFTPNSRTTF